VSLLVSEVLSTSTVLPFDDDCNFPPMITATRYASISFPSNLTEELQRPSLVLDDVISRRLTELITKKLLITVQFQSII